MSLTSKGNIYSWGYSGKGILARSEKIFPQIGLKISVAESLKFSTNN